MLGQVALALLLAAAQTDQTVPVKKGAKLDVGSYAGDITIRVWDRDAVRVEAEHDDDETVDIRTVDNTVVIRGRNARGVARPLDYRLTIPTWMAINIGGRMSNVEIDGSRSDVAVETSRGNIRVRGGEGVVRLRSLQGEVALEKAKGKIEVRTFNKGIRLADIEGDISAESLNSQIALDRIDSSNIAVSTINGSISFDGRIRDKGAYRFSTHNGHIDVAVPDRINATFTITTYNGELRSTLPVKIDNLNARRRTFTFGDGSAMLELATFNGTITLRRPGEPVPTRQDVSGRGRSSNPRPAARPAPAAPPARPTAPAPAPTPTAAPAPPPR